MTQHDPTVRMRHMLDHAKEAVDLLAGKEKADLSRDRVLELALVRLVEIVGEARKQTPHRGSIPIPLHPLERDRRHAKPPGPRLRRNRLGCSVGYSAD